MVFSLYTSSGRFTMILICSRNLLYRAEKVLDEEDHWKSYYRDASGRIVQVEEQAPEAGGSNLCTIYEYRAAGELIHVEQGQQTRTFAYDGLGRMISADYPEIDFTKQWEYTPDGLLEREYFGPYEHDVPGKGRETHDSWVEYGYDGLGRIISKINNWGDFSTGAVDATLNRYFYAYDGEIESLTGEIEFAPVDYQKGRLTGKWENVNDDPDFSYTYSRWAEFYDYDVLGRPTEKHSWFIDSLISEGGHDFVTHYEYNISGGLKQIDYPADGKSALFDLDLENKATSVLDLAKGSLVNNISYAVFGAVETVEVPFAASAKDTLVYQRIHDDSMLRVNQITLTQDALTKMDFTYAYYPDGNVQSIAHSEPDSLVSSEDFTYDGLNRLTEVGYSGAVGGGISYQYDDYGNLETRTATVSSDHTNAEDFDYAGNMGDKNRLPEGDGFEYDERGNLITITHEDTGEIEIMEYDGANRLSYYRLESVTMSPPEKGDGNYYMEEAWYTYNDGFQRIGKEQTNYKHTIESGIYYRSKYTLYVYSPGGELMTEALMMGEGSDAGKNEDQTKELSREFWRDKNFSEEKIKYQFTDHLGTTRHTAGMTWREKPPEYHPVEFYDWWFFPMGYDAYEVETSMRSVNMTPYGCWLHPADPDTDFPFSYVDTDPVHFTGKPRDIESGLDYFGARFKDDFRFTSLDPIIITEKRLKYPQRLNLYSYTSNNPIIFIDPDGEDYYIIAGGTSVGDKDHDDYPRNFLDASYLRADYINRNNSDATVNVIMYTPSYERRALSEGLSKDHYVTLMQNRAKENGFTLMEIQSSNDLTGILSNVEKGGIEGIDYFGHSNPDYMLLEYSSFPESQGSSTDYWGIEGMNKVDRGKFTSNAYFNSWGCFQGIVGGLAQTANILWGVASLGFTGFSHYAPIGQGIWKPDGKYKEYPE